MSPLLAKETKRIYGFTMRLVEWLRKLKAEEEEDEGEEEVDAVNEL